MRAIDAAVIDGAPAAEVAGIALRQVLRLVAADRAAVVVYEPDADGADVLAVEGDRPAGAGDPGDRLVLHEVLPPGLASVEGHRVYLDLVRDLPDLALAQRFGAFGYRAACWAPMRAGGTVLGSLVLMTRDPGALHGDAGRIAEETAGALAIGLRAGREVAARLRAGDRLAALHEIDRSILEAETLDELAGRAAPLVRRLIGADRVIIARYEVEDGLAYRLAADYSYEAEPEPLGVRFPLARILTPEQQRQPRTLLMPEISGTDDVAPGVQFLAQQGMRAGAFVPMVAHGQLQGAVIVGGFDGRFLTLDHLAVVHEIADQLAIAVLHADAHERIARSATRLAIVHDIDRAILAAERPAEIAARAVEALRQLAGADRVSVALFDFERRVSRVIAFAHAPTTGDVPLGTEFNLDEAVDAAILERHETVVYRDVAASAETLPGLSFTVRAGVTAAVIVPLVAAGRLLGVLSIASADPVVASEDTVAVATEVSAQIAIALEHAEAKEAAERSARRLEIVHEIDAAILRSETPATIAQAVAERLLGVTGAELALVARFVPGEPRTILGGAGTGAAEAMRVVGALPAVGPADTLLVTAWTEPRLFPDLREAIALLPPVRVAVDHGLTTGMFVPLVIGGRLIGAMSLAGRDPALLAPDAVATAREVADQLAVAISSADARLELERRVEQQRLVHEVDRAILASASTDEIARRVAAPLARLVHARRLDISAYDVPAGTGRLLAYAVDGTAVTGAPVGRSYPLASVGPLVDVGRREIQVYDDLPSVADRNTNLGQAVAAGLDRVAWVPLLAGERLVGAIGMAGDDPAMTGEAALAMARAMGDQLAVALDRAADRTALAERERRLRAILEASPNGILVVGTSGRIDYANPAAHGIFGAGDGELAGHRHADLVPAGVAADHDRRVGDWLAADPGTAAPANPHPVNLEARRLDGSSFPVHVLLNRLVSEDGTEPLAIVTVVDLSDRVALEARLRQAERLQTLGEFAGILAHDVRNYLTAVTWAAEALAGDLPGDDPRHADVELIQRSARDAVDMTRSVLEFARPAGDSKGSLDVAAHLAGARAVLDRILGDEVTLTIAVEPGLPKAGINATAMTQVLGNLATNARDAMPGGGTLRIAAARHEVAAGDGDGGGLPPGSYVRLTVSDAGMGMDDATRDRAFEAFYTTKTDASTARGTGLGLSSVFLIVTKAGGAIRVESAPGQGTTFTVDLPALG